MVLRTWVQLPSPPPINILILMNELDYLSSLLTAEKKDLLDKVMQYRTRFITVVLEDVYQSHNASAVMRSCEIFGVQDLHVIETSNDFNPNNAISLGAAKWLDTHHYQSPSESLNKLKKTFLIEKSKTEKVEG